MAYGHVFVAVGKLLQGGGGRCEQVRDIVQFDIVDELFGRGVERRFEQVMDMLFAVMEIIRNVLDLNVFLDMSVYVEEYLIDELRAVQTMMTDFFEKIQQTTTEIRIRVVNFMLDLRLEQTNDKIRFVVFRLYVQIVEGVQLVHGNTDTLRDKPAAREMSVIAPVAHIHDFRLL